VAAILGSLMLALGGTQGRDRSTDPAWRAGLVWALVAAICQAGGAVMTRQVFLAVPADAAMTSVLRLLAGILLLLLILPLRRQRLWPASRPGRRTLTLLLGGTLLGTVGGILLQQLAFKYTQAALAQTALATSVILVMVFQAIGGGRVPVRAWLGGLVAVAGVFLLLAGPA
jgi:drug/metabolite transporter (DMT)-like permease